MKLENKESLTPVMISLDWNLETPHFLRSLFPFSLGKSKANKVYG